MNTRLSSQVDHDMRHYSFERRSGLPLAYFDAKKEKLGERLVIASCVCIIISMTLFLIGRWLR